MRSPRSLWIQSSCSLWICPPCSLRIRSLRILSRPAPRGFVLHLGKSRSQGSAAAALLAMATAGLRQGFSSRLQSWMSNSLGDGSKGEGNILFPEALWDCQFPNPALVWCFAAGSKAAVGQARWEQRGVLWQGHRGVGDTVLGTVRAPCWEDSLCPPCGTSLLLV